MTRIWWWLVDKVSRILDPAEQDAVRGDFAESGETGAQALRDVLGLVVRRQAALWHESRPWLVLVGLVGPLSLLVSLISSRIAASNAIYPWMYFNNWDWALLQQRAFWIVLGQTIGLILPEAVALICLAWTIGFALGALSRHAIPITGILFCLALLFGEYLAVPWYTQLQLNVAGVPPPRDLGSADPAALTFYRVLSPLLVQIVLVLVPSVWGMYKGYAVATLPLRLRTILCAPAVATIIVLVSWQAIFWTAIATHNLNLLQRGWHLPLLPFAVAGPIVYWVATASWRHWRGQAASV
jgi:hypothetical protein